jgi:hypothetical protein
MNKEQAIAAITALTGKDIFPRIAKQSQAYKTAIAAVGNPGVPQICGESMGSGNYASSKSWQPGRAWQKRGPCPFNLVTILNIIYETDQLYPYYRFFHYSGCGCRNRIYILFV